MFDPGSSVRSKHFSYACIAVASLWFGVVSCGESNTSRWPDTDAGMGGWAAAGGSMSGNGGTAGSSKDDGGGTAGSSKDDGGGTAGSSNDGGGAAGSSSGGAAGSGNAGGIAGGGGAAGAAASGGSAGSGGSGNCPNGYADCDGDPSNGCEANLSSEPNCGACGVTCGGAPNATVTCSQQKCKLWCHSDFADCDGQFANGCEVHDLSDPNHCASCNHKCPNGPNGTGACMVGSCGFSCNSGWGDCWGGAGCETELGIDPSNCGACKADCGGSFCQAGACTGPPHQVLVSNQDVLDFAISATHVYWVTSAQVARVPKSGGPIESLGSAAMMQGQWIALDGTHVYTSSSSGIQRIPLAGGSVESFVPGTYSPGDLAVNATHVYFGNNLGLHRASKSTGVVELLHATPATLSGEIALDATYVYFHQIYVHRLPLDGGTAVQLTPQVAVNSEFAQHFALGAGYIFMREASGTLIRVPVTGGPPETLVANPNTVTVFAADGVVPYGYGVHYNSANFGGITMQINRVVGGVEQPVAAYLRNYGQNQKSELRGVAVDSTHIYYAIDVYGVGKGEIRRTPK